MLFKGKQRTTTCPHLPGGASPAKLIAGAGAETKNGAGEAVQTAQTCEVCAQEKKAARVYRAKIILGLVLPFTVQAFDMTIIASPLPWIAVEFSEITQLNWIVTAFNLTSAAFIPAWGHFADIFGRHWSLQAAVFIVMGVGAAGIGVIIRVILADKVSLKENAKNNSIFSLVAGVSSGAGPVLGGVLTRANWRWCFGINLPACAVTFIIVFLIRSVLLGPQPIPGLDEHGTGGQSPLARRLKTIDVGGEILSISGVGLMILAFTWAGATYDWDNAAVLVPLIIGALMTAGFILWQYMMATGKLLSQLFPLQRPMLAWELLRQRNISLLFFINFATGVGMYAVLYFVNLYFTMVRGHNASSAGVQLLYYTPGLGVGAYLAMYMCNVWPRNTWWPILLGSTIECAGVAALAYAISIDHKRTVYGMMALAGVGTGLRFMPGTIHAVGFCPGHISSIVAFMGIAMPFGGILGMTIMSTVFNNTSHLSRNSPYRDFSALPQLPADILRQVREDAKMGIVWAFVAITPILFMCMITALALGNVNITKDDIHSGDDAYKANLTEESYLYTILGRRSQKTTE
ncbi:hypothetical protein SAPIO_CDS1886 [Scedosporium apiospermum]|uniref:Major facilitator superfamily (MFS) profile domain-containing protein n=1 Tax=Pseudallescheria apiosperma TaxID=563466 RepID=A0A084GDY9_PSEDA|nr:uncharacterized protein SAPIO_CDS1886 [Scedosporium apiospermum]KEZ45551.1 hypothetical protein SAPIO_CDS1886 [Scedosporium apiospermum]